MALDPARTHACYPAEQIQEKPTMRIAVLCRGSVREGLGHLYRSFSFAQTTEDVAEVRVFAIADSLFASVFHGLRTPPVLASQEDEVINRMIAFSPDVVVTDLVELSDGSFERVRRSCRLLASISPVFRHAARTDLFFTRGHPPAGLSGPRVYSGLPYAILNARCRPIAPDRFSEVASDSVLSVMVSFGGADADNHSRAVLEMLRDIERPLLIWVMLGNGYPHSQDELANTVRGIPRHEIIVARTNRSMWSVASNCALAILSSGLSTLEAIYAGLPVISMHRLNDPAREVVTEYDHLCLDGGRFDDSSHTRLKGIVEDLYDNRHRLQRMRSVQHGLLDGKGAERVRNRILDHARASTMECAWTA